MRSRLLLLSLLVAVVACGDDDDMTMDATVGTDAGDTPDAIVPDATVFDDIPQFNLEACGSQPIAETAFSNDPAVPASMQVNSIVSGRVDPDAAANNQHFWQVDLQAGFYNFIFDETRVDGLDSNLGASVILLGETEDDDQNILRPNEIEKHIRSQGFVEVQNSGTLVFLIEPRFAAEDYTFGIFQNGQAIASPQFEDCPTIQSLTLGTEVSEAVRETDMIPRSEETWYAFGAEITDYLFETSATRADGRDSNIIYRIEAFIEFGDIERSMEVLRVNEIGTDASGSGTLSISEPGTVWVRVRTSEDINITFTATEQ